MVLPSAEPVSGISLAANKVRGVRACVITTNEAVIKLSPYAQRFQRSGILVRVIGVELAKMIIDGVVKRKVSRADVIRDGIGHADGH